MSEMLISLIASNLVALIMNVRTNENVDNDDDVDAIITSSEAVP